MRPGAIICRAMSRLPRPQAGSLITNLKTAKAGLTVPPRVLDIADEVIE